MRMNMNDEKTKHGCNGTEGAKQHRRLRKANEQKARRTEGRKEGRKEGKEEGRREEMNERKKEAKKGRRKEG